MLTRFNLPLGYTYKDKNNVPTCTAEWMEKRFNLFMTYCFPSVAAQTNKDFTWVVMFDVNTDEKYKRENERLKGQCPQYCPVYLNVEQSQKLREYVQDYMRENMAPDTTHVITTRMDNDDALSVDALQKVADYAKAHYDKEYVISLAKGIQYYTEYNISMYIDWRMNHFLSLVEPADVLETVYRYGHGEMDKGYEIVEISKDDVSWMEVCHATNLVNDLHLRWVLKPLEKGFHGETFGITPPVSGCNTLYFRVLVIAPKVIKILLKRFKKKITK